MSEPRRALLTGSTGFVGGHLATRLVETGWTVDTVVRESSDRRVVRAGVTVHAHDGSTAGLHRIVAAARPTVVYHLASRFVAQHAIDDVQPLLDSNVRFPSQLLDAMTACGVGRLVNTGTAWQHFESREFSPVSLYAATKQAFEAILAFYVEARGMRAITLKLFDTYGPGDTRAKLLTLLARAARTRQTLRMSPGAQLMDLVHVDDVARAFALAGERLLAGTAVGHEKYGVSSGAPISLRELVRQFSEVTGLVPPIEWGAHGYREREVMIPWDGVPALPGWSPHVTFADGLQSLETHR